MRGSTREWAGAGHVPRLEESRKPVWGVDFRCAARAGSPSSLFLSRTLTRNEPPPLAEQPRGDALLPEGRPSFEGVSGHHRQSVRGLCGSISPVRGDRFAGHTRAPPHPSGEGGRPGRSGGQRPPRLLGRPHGRPGCAPSAPGFASRRRGPAVSCIVPAGGDAKHAAQHGDGVFQVWSECGPVKRWDEEVDIPCEGRHLTRIPRFLQRGLSMS